MFKRLVLITALSLALLTSSATGTTLIVDPGGSGDYDNIPEAAFHAAADDTVLVMPGTYAVVGSGAFPWPIPIDGDTPTLMSAAGASATMLLGDGTVEPFFVPAGVTDARLFVHGFTFADVFLIIDREDLSPSMGPVHFTDNVVTAVSLPVAPELDTGDTPDGLVARNVFDGLAEYGIVLGIGGFVGLVEDNEVSERWYGIFAADEGAEIVGNHIHHCEQGGITAFGPLTARDNTIEDNVWYGIMLAGTGYLEENTIRRNSQGIVWPGSLFNTPDGYVRMNNIYDNGTDISVPLILGYSVEFDARMNWWGTNDPAEIAEDIFDCHDEWGGECCVLFEPWCTAPMPDCDATPVEATSWGVIKAVYR